MNAAHARPAAAPGVAEIRLSGMPADVETLVSVLQRFAAGLPVNTVGLEILTRSAPYANRRDHGERVYMTVRIELGHRSGQPHRTPRDAKEES